MSNGWERLARQMERGPIAAFGAIFLFIFLFTAAWVVTGFIVNPAVQVGRVVNKTIDSDNMIANYEWFKRQYEAIEAIERKITKAEHAVSVFVESAGDRGNWDREDKIEHSRLVSIYDGLSLQRFDMASEYNARSRMANRSVFKAGDTQLPERIKY